MAKAEPLAAQPEARASRLARTITGWLLPSLGFLLPLAFLPQIGDNFGLPKLFVLKVGLALALVGVAVGADVDGGLLRRGAARLALLYLAVNILATIASVAPWAALFGDYAHNQGLYVLALDVGAFFLAGQLVGGVQGLRRFSGGLFLAGLVTAGLVLLQYAGLDPFGLAIYLEDGRRTYGTIGYPNAVAEFLVMMLPLAAWWTWQQRGLRRDLALWGIFVLVVAIVLTQSRAAWVALLVLGVCTAALAAVLRAGLNRLVGPLVLVPVIMALAATAVLVAIPASSSADELARAASFGRPGQGGRPILERQYLWQSSMAMVLDRPLLGWGTGAFALAYPTYRSVGLDALEDEVGRDDDAHSILLGTAARSGLLGLATFLGLLAALITAGIRGVTRPGVLAERRWAVLALLGSWTSGFLLFSSGKPHPTTDWLGWSVAGALVGLLANGVQPLRLAVPGRAAALVLAVLLTAEGIGSLVADATFARGLELDELSADPEAADEQLAMLRWATMLRPYEPTYQRELGVRLVEEGQRRADGQLAEAGLSHLIRAAELQHGREADVVLEVARATLVRDRLQGRQSNDPFKLAEAALATDPRNPLVYADAAELAAGMGLKESAGDLWKAAAERARSSDAFLGVGNAAVEMGDPVSALAIYRQGAGRLSKPEVRLELQKAWARTAASLGAHDETARAYEAMVADYPQNLEARLGLAEALAASGRREAALRQLRVVLERNPADQQAQEQLRRLGAP